MTQDVTTTPRPEPTGELALAERDVERRLGPVARAALARTPAPWTPDDAGADRAPEYRALGSDPVYGPFAQDVLRRAAARARAVQTGEVPYVAEKAFTADEAPVVERAVATGLWLDAPWADVAADLLRDVVVAPGTARTVPSQAMVFAVARSMRDAPTPGAVAALEAAASTTRHAGLRKKLARYAAAARRNLAGRPDAALRIGPSPTRKELTAWTRTLEACWTLDPAWPAPRWAPLVHGEPATSALAASLVWTATRTGSFRGVPGALVDAAGAPVDLAPDDDVRLWHPAAATPQEREAWREQMWRDRVEQPFAQVLREHYAEMPQDAFVGVVVDAKQLVGIARKQGWHTDPDGLVRTVGGLRAELWTDMSLFPGVSGTARVLGVRVGRSVPTERPGRHAVAPDDGTLPRVPVSELWRSVDLLVSVSAVALDEVPDLDAPPPAHATPAGVLATRRLVLEHVLADLGPSDAARVRVGPRHVEVGATRIHLGTARVTRDGDAVDLAPVARHGLWSPQGDPLLTRVVGLVVAALRDDDARRVGTPART